MRLLQRWRTLRTRGKEGGVGEVETPSTEPVEPTAPDEVEPTTPDEVDGDDDESEEDE